MKKFSILHLRVTRQAAFIAIFIWSLPFISLHPLRSPGITQQSVYRAIDFELRLPGFQLQHLLDGSVVIQADGFPLQDAPGELALPHQVVHLALPPDADAGSLRLEIVSAKIEQLPGSYNIQRIPLDTTTETLGARIVKPPTSPGSLPGYVRLLSSGQMRKWRFIQLDYTPFSVDDASEKVSMASQINLRVHYQTAPDSIDPALLNDTVMDEIAQELFLNYAQAQAWYSPPKSPDAPNVVHDYVIITTNNIETNSTKLDDFIAHKQSLGFSVLTITQDEYGSLVGQSPNGTAEKIRKWLQNNYTSYSIKYVLLIGNPDPDDPSSGSDTVGDVPMKMCWPRWDQSTDRESPTDYFYADLTGNWDLDGDNYYGEYNPDFGTGGVDFANEVFVGRIPVYSTAYSTLDAILQKIIDYENESSPFSWRKSTLLPMSFSVAGYDGAPLAEQMMDDYLDGASFTSWTQYQQGSGECNVDSTYSSNQELRGGTVVRDRWAANDYGLVVWWGHGSATTASVGYEPCWDGTLFSTSQTSSLDDDHPSFVYQNSCTNGYPENTSNLQYALLKQGGLATVSASRVSWFNSGVGYGDFDGSTTNSGIGYEYARRLVQGQPAAQALYNAKTSMVPTSNSRVMNYFNFNLYGDPAAFLLPLLTPTSLLAKPISQAQINLFWTDNSITESGYKIERSPNGSTSWSQIATVGMNVTSYANTRLTCGTPYFYRVRAYNTWGNSPYSSTANATTSACLPGAFSKTNPANSATGVSPSPTLSWGASSNATSYDYCIDTSNDSTCTLPATWINVGSTTNKALSGLSSSTAYYWQVRANNAISTTYANSDTWWMFTTASSSFLYLPNLTQGDHTQPAWLVNGDFECGRNVGRSEYSSHGLDIVLSVPGLQITPHSGSWAAWMGGDDDEISRIWQEVTVSASQSYLHFWLWIASADACGNDFGWVRVNGATVATYNLCSNQATGSWVEKVIDLSAYAGQLISLEFRVETNDSLNSNMFVDDVSFTSLAIVGEQSISDPSISDQVIKDLKAGEE
ncbi:MAG: hypothetical protein JXB15_11060 [Anaerolineales bacterium]|nr:hypothetical protein [Anaerolineales bacterium]